MVIFKCKMCGGTLSVEDGVSVAECEYCGTKQTLPTSNDEVIVNLFNRANNLRLKSEYDKAAEVYEKILEIDDSLAEAHWGLVLCKYGVEYVEDPLTKERIPTCHRTQLVSILTDAEYQAALKYADAASRQLYEQQAQEINELQKKILEIVKTEKPFDVFICYKETDESGARTKDSVIANEIYHELTNSGLKVFYAAITLEDKLGQEYEPYIFAALTSAKVMLVLGTKPEYFNAVWVKNEWSRYLHMMKTDRQTKRTLIPCFRDMDAYDLPDEFSHLQALDMANIAFMPDLTRNISKLLSRKSQKVSSVEEPEADTTRMLKRAFLFIEDGEYDRADIILEDVLNQDPENAKAYIGKLLIAYQLRIEDDLSYVSIKDDKIFKRAWSYADSAYQQVLQGYLYEYEYQKAFQLKKQENYRDAGKVFNLLNDYKDSHEEAVECNELEQARIYSLGLQKMHNAEYLEALTIFQGLGTYQDSLEKIKECKDLEIQALYNEARALMEHGSCGAAADIFQKISGYKDATEKATECKTMETEQTYSRAIGYMDSLEYGKAITLFQEIEGFKDSTQHLQRCRDIMQGWEKSQNRDNFVSKTFTSAIPISAMFGIIGLIIGQVLVGTSSLFIVFGIIGCVIGVIVSFILASRKR